jgi:acetoin utilization deacetylase AcuC-like enzyme
MDTALLADPVYRQHSPGPGHPERPERFDAVLQGLERAHLLQQLPRIAGRRATLEEIGLCHSSAYIRILERDFARGATELSTGDTAVGRGSLEVALHAAGGVLDCVDAVLDRTHANAFCAVRPPGHHATPDRGMGFCIFNNAAIAARYAQKKHGIGNVLIADWDVHHGNGTQDIFYRDPSVLFFSTHQSPWYPGTGAASELGEGPGKGFTINCPFPAGSGAVQIAGAFESILVPAAKTFRPELVIISAGFDSRVGDPLGQFTLTDADFTRLTGIMVEIAAKYAAGRLLSVLEGGYSLSGLASAVAAHVSALRAGATAS